VVVLGAGGRIAADYLTVLDGADYATVVALVEPDPDRRARLSASRPEPVFAGFDPAAIPELDAALVLSPPAAHEAGSIAAVDAGLHVFCEKPLATRPDSARRMLERAAQRERILMMASKFRFTADVAEARRLVRDGAIGTVLRFHNAFRSEVPMRDRWNSDPDVSGGGVLIDNGTHAVDLARFLLGDVARVHATVLSPIQRLRVEDRVRIEFATGSGATGDIELSWSDPGGQAWLCELEGTRGSIAIGWRASHLVDASGKREPFGSGYDKHQAFDAQLRHFQAVTRGLEAARIDDRDALASVDFVAACYRSIAERGWVRLDGLREEVR
jgi:predicted dehydrogenase